MKPSKRAVKTAKRAKLQPDRIHCADGINAVIPEAVRGLKITKEWLQQKGACDEGLRQFSAKFPGGCTYARLRVAIADAKESGFESWMKEKIGGDLASAGYRGTASAGYRGTASAGYRGTASAGDGGTASAGVRGVASAGDGGTASAGDRGMASAGVRGTASAGEDGVLSIEYFDGAKYRRKIGQVGSDGIKPGVKYRLNGLFEFEEVKAVAV